MNNAEEYFKSLERAKLRYTYKLSQDQKKAIYNAYLLAGLQLINKYNKSKEGTATRAYYRDYIQQIAHDLTNIINDYSYKIAENELKAQNTFMEIAESVAKLDPKGLETPLKNIIGNSAKENMEIIAKGNIYKDGKGLSERIWGIAIQSSKDIQGVILAGMAQGMGSVEMSKLLEDYVNPSKRKYWDKEKLKEKLGPGYSAWNKNMEYNAYRLAQTTLSHVATLSMKSAKKVNPYMKRIQWHSIHADGRTCQQCIDRDKQIYTVEKLPFDHPNGLCYMTYVMDKSLEDIAKELKGWVNGEPNKTMDKWAKDLVKSDDKLKKVDDVKKALKPSEKKQAKKTSEKTQEEKPKKEIEFNLDGYDKEAQKLIKDTINELASKYNTRLISVSKNPKAPKKPGEKGHVDMAFQMHLNSTKKHVVVHEFAHTLSMTTTEKVGLTNDKQFWKEISKLFTQYKKDASKHPKKSMSMYSFEDKDEFMAEGFTLAIMNKINVLGESYGDDVEYPNKVLAIVDKYFKKKDIPTTTTETKSDFEAVIGDRYNLLTETANKWIDELSFREKNSIGTYTTSSYEPINNGLRGIIKKTDTWKEKYSNHIERISNALQKSEAPMDMMVYRGSGSDCLKNMLDIETLDTFKNMSDNTKKVELLEKNIVGSVLCDEGFMSTSVDKNAAFNYDIKLEIKIEKGTKGGGFIKSLSAYDKEEEYLLDKGTHLLIEGVRPGQRDEVIIEARVRTE